MSTIKKGFVCKHCLQTSQHFLGRCLISQQITNAITVSCEEAEEKIWNSICRLETRAFLWSFAVNKGFQTVGILEDVMNGSSRKWRHKATSTPKFQKFKGGLDKRAVEVFEGLWNKQTTRGSEHPLSCKVIDWKDHWGKYHMLSRCQLFSKQLLVATTGDRLKGLHSFSNFIS